MIERVIKELEENRQRRLNGDLIAIPWSTMPRLNKVLPGVQQGKYYIVGARTKVGKTQITDYLFMYEVFDWWYKNRDNTDILPSIKYYSLEMSSNLKWMSAISYKLFTGYGILISPQNLRSVFENYILGEDIMKIIKSDDFQHWLKLFGERVTFYDNIRNGFGIYKNSKQDSESKGKWTYKTIPWEENGKIIPKKVRDKFIYNNPHEYNIDITDHLGILHAERGNSLFESIGKFSSEYCIDLRNNYNRTPVNVQQMSASSADAAWTGGGKIILDKLLPTDRDLADNKHTSLDANIMLSLFWPASYNIDEYDGWDLTRIGQNHRELHLNLNRDGISKASINLAFLGQCNYFRELPREPSENTYKQIEKWNSQTI